MEKIVDYAKEELRKVERYKTIKSCVRVVIETKHEEGYWTSTTISGLNLTLEQRDRIITSLGWLRD